MKKRTTRFSYRLAVSAALVLSCVLAYGQVETQNPTAPFWKVNGNSGTTNGTNFVGTTDAQSLDIRTNNVLRVRITQKGQIEVLNTGQSIFIGEGAGNADDLSANQSTFVGYSAGFANTTGFGNAYFGNLAGAAATTTSFNTAVGTAALRDNTTNFNTAVGYSAARSTTTGTGNTAVGYIALVNNTTGSSNTAMGIQALNSNIIGTLNTAIGANALFTNTATNNVAVGANTLYNNTSGTSNTAVGRSALSSNTTGNENTAMGTSAMDNSTGSANTAVGAFALRYVSGYSNTAVGFATATANITGRRNTFLGDSANVMTDALTNATAIGWNARIAQSNSMLLGSIQGQFGSTATVRVGIGTDAPARALHLGNDTLGFRYEGVSTGGSFITAPNAVNDRILFANGNGDVSAMPAGSNGDVLTFTASGPAWSTSAASTAWELTGNAGTVDGTNFIGTTDGVPFTIRVNNSPSARIDHTNRNAFWGYSSGGAITATFNTAIGHQAMFSNSTGLGNTALGAFALHGAASGESNVAIGVQTMSLANTGNFNTAVGTNAMLSNSSGGSNTSVGFQSMYDNTTGGNNTSVGLQSMYNNTTGRSNIGIGVRALYSNSTLIQQIAIGDSALYSNNAGSGGNTAVGYKALRTNASGNFNTAIGYSAAGNVTASNNTTIGYANFSAATSYGSANTSVGSFVCTTNQTGSNNAFLGMGIPNLAFSVGDDNVMVGPQAGNQLDGPITNQNVFIGSNAGLRTDGGSNSGNVVIGTLAYANDAPSLGTLTNNVLLGYAARSEGNTNNTVLGANARSTPMTANTNTTVIGANAQVTAVNNFIIGDTISRPQVGIGVTAVGKTLSGTRFEIATEGTVGNILYRYQGSGTPSFSFMRSLGSLSSATSVNNGSTLGRFDFYGYEGTNWDIAGGIIAAVDSTPATSIVPSRITFNTQSSQGGVGERMRVDRRGHVGIGETNPRTRLHVNSGVDAALATIESGYLMIGNELSTNLLFDDNEIMARSNSAVSNLALQGEGGSVWVHQVGAVDADDFMITDDDDVRVGIGVGQFPAYQLELALNSAGKPGSNIWTIVSDERLKKDIEPFQDGLSVLQQVNPVWYTYNGKGGIRDTSRFVGIIAQEMQKIAPYTVNIASRKEADSTFTEYLNYDGNAMTYILINSVKEQQVTIEQLKARLEQQQLEIEELKKRN